MVMQPDAYSLISGQNPDERLKNRKMLLQPVPQPGRQIQAVKYSFNDVKQFHNSPPPGIGRDLFDHEPI